ncbi:MAG: type II secretion system protein [Candidatus Andersenbacteria bacterium]|nr:type II secretion system protein [Candidatus Andersenbacteria bacterium]
MSAGFTLVETLVTITIMTILTGMTVTAFPRVRASQQVQNDVYVLRSLIADAQQRSLNEVREDDCIAKVGEERERVCSNVGVALLPGEFVEFSDTDENRRFSGSDFVIVRRDHVSTVSAPKGNNLELLFEATPPNVFLFADGTVIGPNTGVSFSLESGKASRTMRVRQFGITEFE